MAAALRVTAELAYGVPDLEPPAGLRGSVLAVVGREAPTRPAPLPHPSRRSAGRRRGPVDGRRSGPAVRRRAGRWRALLAAAALVAVSAGATWQVTRPAGPAPAAPVAADRTATLTARDGTVATVVVRAGGADVVTDELPPSPGRATDYVLWGVPAGDAAPQRLGSFQVTAAGLRSYPVRLVRPAAGYPVLAISEEPAGSTPTLPTRVLARGALR